jgi:hypothetical protein
LLKLSYTEKGQLSGLLGEYSTSQEVLIYKDLLITTARAFDPLVVGVQPTETWIKLKVHGVSLNRYLKPRGLELANEEIELQNKTQLPYLPRWLKPKEILQQGYAQNSSLVVTIRDRQLANKLLQAGLYFGGKRHLVERYWESGKGEICPKCCKFGHFEGCSKEEARCYLCAGPHLAQDHLCPVEGCGNRTLCRHIPAKCVNCSGRHVTTSIRCPKKWEDMRQPQRSSSNHPQPKTPERPRTPQMPATPERPYTILETPRTALRSSPPSTGMDIDGLSIPSIVFTPTQAAQNMPKL